MDTSSLRQLPTIYSNWRLKMILRSFRRPRDPRDGNSIRQYGLAWFGDDRDGFPLYIMGHKDIENDPNLPDISVFKADPETEDVRFVTGLPDIDPLCQGRCGITITPDWNNLVMVFAAILDNPDGDIAVAYELDLNTTWINYNPRVDTLGGGSSVDLEFCFDASGFDIGLYQIGLEFTHNAFPGLTMLPIVFDVDYHAVDEDVTIPLDYSLSQNHPNPFNPITEIAYSLREAGSVKLVVYDMLGREVDMLVDGYRAAGRYNVSFDARNLAAGLYFYRLETDEFRVTRKMALMK